VRDLSDIRKRRNIIIYINIPFGAAETNFLSNLFPMQMFGHRIKYLFESLLLYCAAAPNRLGGGGSSILLSFYHAQRDKLLSSVSKCMCACTDDIHFFHEESSCTTGRHNARQMVPKTQYSPRQSMPSSTEKKYVYNNVHNIMISFYLQLSIIKTAPRPLGLIRKIDF
jgi:hypothetical protein